MKKGLLSTAGVLAVLLVFGMAVVGCDDGSKGGDEGVDLPTIYQNTTWVNAGDDDDYNGNYYSKISFKTTSATIYRDEGNITDNTGTVYNVKSVGPNNSFTNQLGTNMSQIYLEKPRPPSASTGGDDIPVGNTIAVYIFVKDNGTGLFIQTLGYNSSDITEQKWTKQK